VLREANGASRSLVWQAQVSVVATKGRREGWPSIFPLGAGLKPLPWRFLAARYLSTTTRQEEIWTTAFHIEIGRTEGVAMKNTDETWVFDWLPGEHLAITWTIWGIERHFCWTVQDGRKLVSLEEGSRAGLIGL
jgi:hypothetical protein